MKDDALQGAKGPDLVQTGACIEAADLAALSWDQASVRLAPSGSIGASRLQQCAALALGDKVGPSSLEGAAKIWCEEFWPRQSLAEQTQSLWSLWGWLADQKLDTPRLHAAFVSWSAALCQHWTAQQHARQDRQSRLVMVGQLFASIAHELRNPLAVLESSIFLLRTKHGQDPPSIQHLQKMTRSVARCHEIIRGVLDMVRQTPPRIQAVPAIQIWRELQEQFPSDAVVRWSLQVPADLTVHCEPRLLLQCLATLVQNALVAMHGGGDLTCKTSVQRSESGDGLARFEVCDTGPGFPQEVIARGVELLVSGRVGGTGLGLALAQSIAQRHGGELHLSNLPAGGARVCIEIPQPSA